MCVFLKSKINHGSQVSPVCNVPIGYIGCIHCNKFREARKCATKQMPLNHCNNNNARIFYKKHSIDFDHVGKYFSTMRHDPINGWNWNFVLASFGVNGTVSVCLCELRSWRQNSLIEPASTMFCRLKNDSALRESMICRAFHFKTQLFISIAFVWSFTRAINLRASAFIQFDRWRLYFRYPNISCRTICKFNTWLHHSI